MKKRLSSLLLLAMVILVFAAPVVEAKRTYNSHHGPTYKVRSYTTKKGTHVQSYKRTAPNHTKKDNLYVNH